MNEPLLGKLSNYESNFYKKDYINQVTEPVSDNNKSNFKINSGYDFVGKTN